MERRYINQAVGKTLTNRPCLFKKRIFIATYERSLVKNWGLLEKSETQSMKGSKESVNFKYYKPPETEQML